MRDWHGDIGPAFGDDHLVGLVTHNGHCLALEPGNQVFVHWHWVHHRPEDFRVFGRDRRRIDLCILRWDQITLSSPQNIPRQKNCCSRCWTHWWRLSLGLRLCTARSCWSPSWTVIGHIDCLKLDWCFQFTDYIVQFWWFIEKVKTVLLTWWQGLRRWFATGAGDGKEGGNALLANSLFSFYELWSGLFLTSALKCWLWTDPGAQKCSLSPQLISEKHVRRNVLRIFFLFVPQISRQQTATEGPEVKHVFPSPDNTLAYFSILKSIQFCLQCFQKIACLLNALFQISGQDRVEMISTLWSICFPTWTAGQKFGDCCCQFKCFPVSQGRDITPS